MPVSRSPDAVSPAPSLFSSVRTFWRALLGNFHTRLDLFTTELEDEAVRVVYTVVSGLIGVMALHGAFFFAMLWILASVWDTAYRLWVIGGIFLVYFVIGAATLGYAWSLVVNRPKFLSQTLAELKRDAEGFQASIATKESP